MTSRVFPLIPKLPSLKAQDFHTLTRTKSIITGHGENAHLTGPGIKEIRDGPGSSFGHRGFRLTKKKCKQIHRVPHEAPGKGNND